MSFPLGAIATPGVASAELVRGVTVSVAMVATQAAAAAMSQ